MRAKGRLMTMQAMTGKTEGKHSALLEVLAMETGERAAVHGLVHTLRDLGDVRFALLRMPQGVLQCVLFPRSGLLGASGIVFMLIMLSSLAGFSGGIPVTMLLVAALYFGQQVYDIIFVHDNVANFMHIVGGLCGTAFGYYSALHSRRRPAKAVKFSSTNSRRKH